MVVFSNIAQSSTEVMDVVKDCHQTFVVVFLWWCFWWCFQTLIVDCHISFIHTHIKHFLYSTVFIQLSSMLSGYPASSFFLAIVP